MKREFDDKIKRKLEERRKIEIKHSNKENSHTSISNLKTNKER